MTGKKTNRMIVVAEGSVTLNTPVLVAHLNRMVIQLQQQADQMPTHLPLRSLSKVLGRNVAHFSGFRPTTINKLFSLRKCVIVKSATGSFAEGQ